MNAGEAAVVQPEERIYEKKTETHEKRMRRNQIIMMRYMRRD